MTGARVRRRSGRTARERVAALLARDFPGAAPALGDCPAELLSGKVRAVVRPAEEAVPGDEAGIDWFVFPSDSPVSGVAVLFSAGDPVLRAIRRYYLPPVVFAGAGPGGTALMTLSAARSLESADVVLADCLCGEEFLRFVRPGAEVVAVGKRCGKASAKQEDITRAIVEGSRRGRRIVRLKGGDPSVFGRLEEETRALRALGLGFRVIPGVGAASAAAAFVGQPLTVREIASEIVFSTGRFAGGGKNPFPLDGRAAPAIALYMSRKVLGERMADLVPAGYSPDTPVVVVEKLGCPEARAVTGTIETIAGIADREEVGTPAVVLVGAQFHAPDHLPLAGVRIWLPAESETAEAQREPLEELGATCVLVPLIEPVPLPVDEGALLTRPFDWVLFTSKKSVDFFFAALSRWGFDSRWLPRVAAIGGPTIEKLRARGIEPDLIPPEPTRVALSTSLVTRGLAGMRILIPASAVAPDHVRAALEPHAAEVVRADLYTLRFPPVEAVPEADVVLFSSETTVRSARANGLVPAIRERGMVVGGIGPATRRAIEEAGLFPAIVPDGTDPASLARGAHRYFANLALARIGAGPR